MATSEEEKKIEPAQKNDKNSQSFSSGYDLKYVYGKTSKSQVLHNTTLDIYHTANKLRSSGIVCTIGPASQSVEMLTKLIRSGMDVVRMNCSHGTHEYHKTTVANAHKAATTLGENIAIALDTKGPEIRTGNFVDNAEVFLEVGKKVKLTTDESFYKKGTVECFYVDYKNITKVCQAGDFVFIDDGLVKLKIEKVNKDNLECVVKNSGSVSNHKGVNLPNIDVDLPAVSEKDKKDLQLGVELGVDMIFASFIRKPQDIIDIRKVLVDKDPLVGKRIQIISKIENHEGVQNFDAILKETDGVMVARGDLGIEIEAEKVFLAQKMMIAKCNIAGKPVIVATQMLESMTKNPRPTRAEVSDVANAVLDGADCVMLSGETAKGKYPTQSVSIMARICREAESARNSLNYFQGFKNALKKPLATQDTVCSSAVSACFEQCATAVIVLTNSGTTARIIAKYKPPCPVIAVVGNKCSYTARQLRITCGVFSVTYEDSKGKPSIDQRVKIGLDYGKKQGWIGLDDFVVCIHADTMGKGFANLVKIIQVE